jgi:hypothetical protein
MTGIQRLLVLLYGLDLGGRYAFDSRYSTHVNLTDYHAKHLSRELSRQASGRGAQACRALGTVLKEPQRVLLWGYAHVPLKAAPGREGKDVDSEVLSHTSPC